jgi:YegS/Rv2252/BmrU family lipid kinase
MSILVIINPISGSGKAMKIYSRIKAKLGMLPVKEVVSTKAGHIYELAFSLGKGEYDKVILVGGDGTFHEFINGMLNRDDGFMIPIGLIPAGTGNSLMHDLKLLDPNDAIDKIIHSKTEKIDIAKVTFEKGHVFAFNVIGWGLPSTINQKAEKLKFFGGQRYNVASLLEIIRHPKWELLLNIDGKKSQGQYSFFMACNTIHTGKGMKVAPKASLQDGKFDIVLLKEASRFKLIKLFSKIFKGDHIHSDIVEYSQASSFSLEESVSSKLIIDGQVVGTTPFSAEVLPKTIEIFI